MLGAKCDVHMGCHTKADIWAHGVVERDGEKLACGAESGMDGSIKAWWEFVLVGKFKNGALGSASCGL